MTEQAKLRNEQMMAYQETLKKTDELIKKTLDPKYKEQGYADGVNITMSGALYTQITNLISLQSQVNRTSMEGLEALEMAGADVSYKLMKLHLDNVDNGVTSSFETLDKEDAKTKIKEVKK